MEPKLLGLILFALVAAVPVTFVVLKVLDFIAEVIRFGRLSATDQLREIDELRRQIDEEENHGA